MSNPNFPVLQSWTVMHTKSLKADFCPFLTEVELFMDSISPLIQKSRIITYRHNIELQNMIIHKGEIEYTH